MNKSVITNLVTLGFIAGGYMSPWYSRQLLSTGLFALSGAMTNWLAVHMLFEKVPLVYGSGVIPLNFKILKRSIKTLVMEQFFRDDNIARFLDKNALALASDVSLTGFHDLVDFDEAFDMIKMMVLDSKLGGLLQIFGGQDALEQYRPVFWKRGQEMIGSLSSRPEFKEKMRDKLNNPAVRTEVIKQLERLIEDRLQELTPVMVKDIMYDMMQKHLGWLVVWGGVFGGLLGMTVSFISWV